jgi:hypothetical protein
MTEHRPSYFAFSSIGEGAQSTTTSPLEQHYVDGTVSRDTILLLPVLSSPLETDQPSVCLQLVHLEGISLGFCNVPTKERCACCDAPTCQAHATCGALTVIDENGLRHLLNEALLCETCAHLDTVARTALSTLRRLLNGQTRYADECVSAHS